MLSVNSLISALICFRSGLPLIFVKLGNAKVPMLDLIFLLGLELLYHAVNRFLYFGESIQLRRHCDEPNTGLNIAVRAEDLDCLRDRHSASRHFLLNET